MSRRTSSRRSLTSLPGLSLATGSALVGREVALARAAHGTEPGVRDVLERGPRRDAAVGVAVGRVVDEPAGLADVALRGTRLAHMPQQYISSRGLRSAAARRGDQPDRRG